MIAVLKKNIFLVLALVAFSKVYAADKDVPMVPGWPQYGKSSDYQDMTVQGFPQFGKASEQKEMNVPGFPQFGFKGEDMTAPQAQGPKAIQWQKDTISFNEILNILNQNSGINQFNIRFPNQSNWQFSRAGLGNMYRNFLSSAKTLGMNGASLPNLSFSSLGEGFSGDGEIGVPFSNDSTALMDEEARARLEQMGNNSHGLNIGFLPKWLQSLVNIAYGFILQICEQIRNLF